MGRGEARKTASFFYNRATSAHCDRDSTSPYEKYFGVKPQVNKLRVFDSVCYPTNVGISANVTSHLKTHGNLSINKPFEFPKNCTIFKQTKGKSNFFTGIINSARYTCKQWYANIKEPFAIPSLVHGNIHVFGIIEAKSRMLI